MLKTKLLKRMILMVSVPGMFLLSMPGVSSAEDVWCYSSYGFSYYLSSDTISKKSYPSRVSYAVDGKLIHDSDGSLARPLMYGFNSDNDILAAYTFNRTNGKWEEADKSEAMAVWNAMKPYMKQKGIHYSDSWK